MFIDTGIPACGPACKPGCHCGKYFEIWNDVFMQYNKTAEGHYPPLAQKTVDTGMGVERTIAMMQGKKTVFETELFWPIIERLQALAGKAYGAEPGVDASIRIIADHLRSSVFILGDDRGVKPSNLGQGYILRRLDPARDPPRPQAGPGEPLPRRPRSRRGRDLRGLLSRASPARAR